MLNPSFDRFKDEPWLKALVDVQQNINYHLEDVFEHTRMVHEQVQDHPDYAALDKESQTTLSYAALLHDVGKPSSMCREDGIWRTRNHATNGAIIARKILYGMDMPFKMRESICGLVRNHMRPKYWISAKNSKHYALNISTTSSLELLRILCVADVIGRKSPNSYQETLNNLELFFLYCQESELLNNLFANDHSRFLYFRDQEAEEPYAAFHDPRCNVIIMSGLPGAGKDYWISNNADYPTISLDDIRRTKKISPTKDQGEVIAEAYSQARNYLRNRTSFVWNGTNITHKIRAKIINLLASYNAHITIVYVEPDIKTLFQQNKNREHPVPEQIIYKLLDKLEVPDITEAHKIVYVTK